MKTVYSTERPKFGIMKQTLLINYLPSLFRANWKCINVFFYFQQTSRYFQPHSIKNRYNHWWFVWWCFCLLVVNVAVFKYVILFARYMLAEMTFLRKFFSCGFMKYYMKLIWSCKNCHLLLKLFLLRVIKFCRVCKFKWLIRKGSYGL